MNEHSTFGSRHQSICIAMALKGQLGFRKEKNPRGSAAGILPESISSKRGRLATPALQVVSQLCSVFYTYCLVPICLDDTLCFEKL